MTGKILGQGAIRGEDGVRYYYDDGAIKNLQDVQNINGCEVDFEIKNGKAVDIFIIKSGESSSKSSGESSGESKQNNNSLGQTLGNLGNLANNLGGLASRLGSNINTKDNKSKSDSNQQKVSVDNVDDFIFSGIVSNSQNKLSDTLFDIGNKNFIWNNTLINRSPISDGDEVAVCATPASNGQYRVQSLKNNTKGLFFEKSFFAIVMRAIPVIAIFGPIAMWFYLLLSKGAYKSGFGLVFNLLFIACVILGYFIFKKIKNKDTSFVVTFMVFSSFMFIALAVFTRMDLLQGYHWAFMISVVSSVLTIEAIMFLKSNYNLTKLNDTIKNYKF